MKPKPVGTLESSQQSSITDAATQTQMAGKFHSLVQAGAACQQAISNKLSAQATGRHLILNRQRKSADELLGFQNPTSETHTMASSLSTFVNQKLPVSFLKDALNRGEKIEVIECNPDIFMANAKDFGYKEVSKVDFKHNQSIKRYNYGRPVFFNAVRKSGKKAIVLATMAGQDYHKHYTAIIRNFLVENGYNVGRSMRTVSCPDLRKNLFNFRGFDGRFVKKGDVLVIGHVSDIEKQLYENTSMNFLSSHYDKVGGFGSRRFKMPNGRVMNLVGVRDSFWGEMASRVVKCGLTSGASEVIYAAKLGCLTDKSDIYKKTFSPTKYIVLDHTNVTNEVSDVRNPVVGLFPHLNSGTHASVPTVLEEMHDQREVMDSFNVRSIDNEISTIAQAVSNHNKKNKTDIGFSAIHFATDYLRKNDEAGLHVDFDLSNNRTEQAVSGKGQKLRDISSLLENYFYEQLPLDTSHETKVDD
jgi:hypothetical protein